MATEFTRLTAILETDASRFDAGLAQADTKVATFGAKTKAVLSDTAKEFQTQFGYLPTIVRREFSSATQATQNAVSDIARALTPLERHVTSAAKRLGDLEVSKSLTKGTNDLVAQSVADVARLDKAVLGLRNSQEGLGKSYDAVQRGANSFSSALDSTGEIIGGTAGMMGLAVTAAGAMLLSLAQLATAQVQVVAVTKEQINVTQERIKLLYQELEATTRLAVGSDAEVAARQRSIDAKRQQIALSQERAQVEEIAVVRELVQAIFNQEQAEIKLHNARVGAIQSGSTYTGTIKAANDALKEAQKDTQDAADAADVYSAATGRSRQEIFAQALALVKQGDAAGNTYNAFEDLVRVLGLTIDSQGRLTPTVDAATSAIERQTAAIRKQNSVLDAQAALRDATVRMNVEQIASQNLTGKQALGELQRRRADSLFTDSEFGNLDSAIRTNQRVAKLRESLEEIISPSKGRGGRGGGEAAAQRGARQALESIRMDVQRAERIAQGGAELEKQRYEASLQSLERYVERRKQIENIRFETDRETFRKERELIDASVLDAGEKSLKLRKVQDDEEASQLKHNQVLLEIDNDRRNKERAAREKHYEASLRLSETFNQRELSELRGMVEAGLVSREQYETRSNEILQEAHARRMDVLARELLAASGDEKRFEEVLEKKLQAEEEFINANIEGLRRIDKARQEDIESARKYSKSLRDLQSENLLQAIDIGRGRLERDERLGDRGPRATRRQMDVLDLAEENETYARRVEEAIETLNQQLLSSDINTLQERQALLDAYYEQAMLMAVGHEDRVREIEERALVERREHLKQIAGELTDIVTAGFEGGWEGVLSSFTNLLQQLAAELINSTFLQILTGKGQESSAGGLVGFFTNLILGAVTGGVSGGGGGSTGGGNAFGGGFYAEGGTPPVGKWSVFGEKGPELAWVGSPTTVFSNADSQRMLAGGGGNTYVNITLPPMPNRNYTERRSQREMAEMAARAVLGRLRR